LNQSAIRIVTPDPVAHSTFTDAAAATAQLISLYETATRFLTAKFSETVTGSKPAERYRAFYPEIRFTTTTFATADSRLSFGHVAEPGT
jgi:AMP nucleosidase